MSKPGTTITVAEAKQLQANWMSTRAVDIEKAMGSKDVSDVTFSLSELEAFVQYVKDESTKQGIENPGVRVYFSAYDNEENDKATVFLAPTKGVESTSDDNYNIDPLNFGHQGWPPRTY